MPMRNHPRGGSVSARRRLDGTIELLGRVDDQLKVDGYRVEPHQVETALATHPDITQAAVTVHANEPRVLFGQS
jgi:acyl-coenzyme A synthetase/AMP-(fatty) acid ligase